MKGIEYLREVYRVSGISITRKPENDRARLLKQMVQRLGFIPEDVFRPEFLYNCARAKHYLANLSGSGVMKDCPESFYALPFSISIALSLGEGETKISAVMLMFLIVLAVFSTVSLKTLTSESASGLVGYWTFDEGSGTTASDISGNGNTGTLHGGATWTVGKYGKALDFNGVDGYVQIPPSSSLDVTAQVTVEAWVNLRAYVDSNGYETHLVSRSNNMGGPYYVLATHANGKIGYDIGLFTGYHQSAATLPLNSWTHLAMTYNGATVYLYINGVPDSNYAQSGPIPTTPNWLAIGCKPTGTQGGPGTYAYTNGKIDDVRIYNRALTQQEIQTDMNTGSQGDLSIEDIQPVQTLVNCSTLIPGKPTVFNMTIISTYPYDKKNVYLQIKCGSLSPWYEGPIENIPKNGKIPFCTGGQYSHNWVSYVGQAYFPSGEFDVTITIDVFSPNAHSFPKHIGTSTGYQFKDLGQLKILYVPTGFWGGPYAWIYGDPKISNDEMKREQASSDSFIKAVYPVNPSSYISEIGAECDLITPASLWPPARMSMATMQFWDTEINLRKYHQPDMGGYSRVVAVVPYRGDGAEHWLDYWLGLSALGNTAFSHDTVTWCEKGYWATPAHELIHSYTDISDKVWHCPNSGSGYWDQKHAPFITNGQPLACPCLMQGGDSYESTLSDGSTMSLYQWICPQCYANLTAKTNFAGADPEVLFVDGIVFENDTANLLPFYHFSNGYADLESGNTGNYTLRFLDASMQLLSDVGFNMTFDPYFNVTGFGFAVPYPSNTSQIQLLHGDTVIASRSISANPPLVNMTYPSSGETLTSGQNVTIQWQASDQDNDTLSYTVLYTPDNGSSWIPIQTDVTDTSLNWTVPDDHPADQCRVKVIATDGVNTGEAASSGTFTIFRHGVSTDDIQMPKSIIGNGFSMPINITISNSGNYTETPRIDIYANTTLINSQNVTLSNGNSTMINLTWNTTGFTLGNYTISACAWPVPGETDTSDNNFTGGRVVVSRVGDLTGGSANSWDFVPDGVVDGSDLSIVARCFGSWPAAQPPIIWNTNCDVNNDGVVDGSDLAIVARHFGEGGP